MPFTQAQNPPATPALVIKKPFCRATDYILHERRMSDDSFYIEEVTGKSFDTIKDALKSFDVDENTIRVVKIDMDPHSALFTHGDDITEDVAREIYEEFYDGWEPDFYGEYDPNEFANALARAYPFTDQFCGLSGPGPSKSMANEHSTQFPAAMGRL